MLICVDFKKKCRVDKPQMIPRVSTNELDTELGPYAQKVLKQKTDSYQTNFDFNIYDFIANRFGHTLPKGGVIYKSPFTVSSKKASTIFLDAYGRGCTTNSFLNSYKDALVAKGDWNRPMPFPADVVGVYSELVTLKKQHGKKLIIEIGLKSDPFQWMDMRYKVAKEYLFILKSLEIKYVINTCSDLLAHEDYIEHLDKNLATVEMRMPKLTESELREKEPGSPSLKRRQLAIDLLIAAGIKVKVNRKMQWKKA